MTDAFDDARGDILTICCSRQNQVSCEWAIMFTSSASVETFKMVLS